MTSRNFFVVFVFLSSVVFSFAAQAKDGFFPTRFIWAAQTLSHRPLAVEKNTLKYYGGPVIGNPHVWVVMWGDRQIAEVRNGMADFFKAMTNSTYMDWLDEYNTLGAGVNGHKGTGQHLGRGVYMGTVTIKPSHTGGMVDDGEIQAEIQSQIDAGVLPKPDENTLYMIYFPVGMQVSAFGMTSCVDFCAYHSSHGTPETPHFYYGVMPDIGGLCADGCGYGFNSFDSITAISSHEFIEATTDPFPTAGTDPDYPQAWNDSQGSEIGDLCVGGNNVLKTPAGTYTVQSEWDNSKNGCTDRDWQSP